jgi:hypothetical protein
MLLLCNDHQMGGHTRVVSGQQLCKHVRTTKYMNATIEERCFQCGPCRDIICKRQCYSLVSSVQESVKRGLEPGSRGITTVRALIRKRLVTD